jgi:hypothetical protein
VNIFDNNEWRPAKDYSDNYTTNDKYTKGDYNEYEEEINYDRKSSKIERLLPRKIKHIKVSR